MIVGAIFGWCMQVDLNTVIIKNDLADKKIYQQIRLLLQGFGVKLTDHALGDLVGDRSHTPM